MSIRTRAIPHLSATIVAGVMGLALATALVGWHTPNHRDTREVLEERFPDGRLHVRREVTRGADGQPTNDGELTVWYPNGQVRSVGTWRAGQKHGRFTHWHANGQKARVLTYVDGRAQGFVREWDENGRLEREEQWEAGHRVR